MIDIEKEIEFYSNLKNPTQNEADYLTKLLMEKAKLEEKKTIGKRRKGNK